MLSIRLESLKLHQLFHPRHATTMAPLLCTMSLHYHGTTTIAPLKTLFSNCYALSLCQFFILLLIRSSNYKSSFALFSTYTSYLVNESERGFMCKYLEGKNQRVRKSRFMKFRARFVVVRRSSVKFLWCETQNTQCHFIL